MDVCNEKISDLAESLDKIQNNISNENSTIDKEYIMIDYNGNTSDSIIDIISKNIDLSTTFYKLHIDVYNSFCKFIRNISQSLANEINEQKCSTYYYELGCKYYNNLKVLVDSMNYNNGVKNNISFNITTIKFTDKSETSVDIVTVNSDEELNEYPPGLLVYHTGYKVPKFILTTGNKYEYIEVPSTCNIIGAEDDVLRKYTIFNDTIITNKNFNMGYNNFYIDKKVSEITGFQEDETRNFRHPMQNNKKQWNGYNVFKQPKFGDFMLLDEQLCNDISSDKRDLYQYSLWMTIIGLTNYQKKYKNNKSHID
jgi:hypothetical protein